MADPQQGGLSESAQKHLDAMNAARDKSREEYESKMKGKPTPTQDELNRIKMGEHIMEKEADGSDPDPGSMPIEHRHMEAKPASGASYKTRAATASPSLSGGSASGSHGSRSTS